MFPFGQNKQQMYQQDAQVAAAGDDSRIDPTDVGGNLQQCAQNAQPDIQGQLDPSDPRAMVQGSQQAVQQRPDLVQRVKHHPVASVAVAGLAAMAAKHIWDQHQARGRLLDLDRGSVGMGGPSPRCRASWAWRREETGEEVARGPAAR